MEYVLNKNPQMHSSYHKIHQKNCPRRPKKENIINLGDCFCPYEAKSRAKEHYKMVSGCKYCCKEIDYQK